MKFLSVVKPRTLVKHSADMMNSDSFFITNLKCTNLCSSLKTYQSQPSSETSCGAKFLCLCVYILYVACYCNCNVCPV